MLKTPAGGERELSPEETKEEQAYAALTKAAAERDRIWGEIKKILDSATDREKGGQEELAELMPQYEQALDDYDNAFAAWREAVQEANEKGRADLAIKE